MGPLSLDIVGLSGRILHLEGLDAVVVRRRETMTPGSEVAVLRGHAPLLMQTQECVLRYVGPEGSGKIAVGEGLLEVFDGHVSLALTHGSEKIRTRRAGSTGRGE